MNIGLNLNENFSNKITDERLIDTITDLAGYALLAKVYLCKSN